MTEIKLSIRDKISKTISKTAIFKETAETRLNDLASQNDYYNSGNFGIYTNKNNIQTFANNEYIPKSVCIDLINAYSSGSISLEEVYRLLNDKSTVFKISPRHLYFQTKIYGDIAYLYQTQNNSKLYIQNKNYDEHTVYVSNKNKDGFSIRVDVSKTYLSDIRNGVTTNYLTFYQNDVLLNNGDVLVSKGYIDTQTDLALSNSKMYTDAGDAVTLSSAKTYTDAKHLNDILAPTSNVNFASFTGFTTKSSFNSNEFVTKSYVDTQDTSVTNTCNSAINSWLIRGSVSLEYDTQTAWHTVVGAQRQNFPTNLYSILYRRVDGSSTDMQIKITPTYGFGYIPIVFLTPYGDPLVSGSSQTDVQFVVVESTISYIVLQYDNPWSTGYNNGGLNILIMQP